MATRKKPCTEATVTARRGLPPAYYQLHALLETLRALRTVQLEDVGRRVGARAGQRSGRVPRALSSSVPAPGPPPVCLIRLI